MKTENAKLSDWVWEQPGLTPGERLVCLALLRFRNNRTGLCYPSQDSISRITGMSRSGVQKALRSLRAKHFLASEEAPGQSNRYSIGAHSVSTPCSLSKHKPNSNQEREEKDKKDTDNVIPLGRYAALALANWKNRR